MNDNSQQINLYLEYLTGNLIHITDTTNNSRITNDEYEQLSKELDKIGESTNNIFQILKLNNHNPSPINHESAHKLTQERKTQILRDNKINTILK
jgi:benzoyl-CoA reductase/2-hydroxyglutaryl-CoA dehydratase subunit BcrC/BadD/HgdB